MLRKANPCSCRSIISDADARLLLSSFISNHDAKGGPVRRDRVSVIARGAWSLHYDLLVSSTTNALVLAQNCSHLV